MGKRFSKAIALALAVGVLGSFTACKKEETKSGTKANEEVTLKIWAPNGSSATGINGIHDDPIVNEIKKKTGVTLDFVYDLTPEKYNAMLASGDLPDIMTVWNKDIGPLIEGKNIIDMEGLIKDHGKDIMKETPEKVQFSKQFMSGGQNKVYFIPTWDNDINPIQIKSFNNGTGIGMFVRWDLYKEIGYPEVQNDIFGLIPILKQMQDKHPTTSDGKKVYGLSPWLGDWDLWNFTVLTEGMMNVDAEHESFIDLEIKDNGYMKSQIGDTSSTLWTGAKFLNKAYQAGILDPDSVTQKYDGTVEKLNAGRVLFNTVNWGVSGPNGFYAQNGHPEQGFMALKTPSSIKQTFTGFSNPYGDRWSFAISSKCKNPEKAMDLINYISSSEGMRVLLNGIEGTDWKVDSDGVPRWTEETKKFRKESNSEQLNARGFDAYTQFYGRADDIADPKYKTPANFKYNEDLSKQTATSPLYQDYSKHYGVEYPDQIFEKTLTNKKDVNGAWLAMADTTPTEIKQIDDSLLNYLKAELVKSVISKTDADFEKVQQQIIDQCKKMGYEKAFQWHKDNYEKAREKLAQLKK